MSGAYTRTAPERARRKKELVVNESGKNISPTAIEADALGCRHINQTADIGDGRPYVDRLSRPEQIQRFRLVDNQWSVEAGDLAPTFKLRQRAVLARSAAVIDSLYAQTRDGA